MEHPDIDENGNEVVIALEGQDYVYERYYINGVAVLVDSTPFDDPDVISVHNLFRALPDMVKACKAFTSTCPRV